MLSCAMMYTRMTETAAATDYGYPFVYHEKKSREK